SESYCHAKRRELHRLAYDKLQHVPRTSPQSRAQADLASPLRHRVAHHAVDPYNRKRHRDRGKNSKHHQREALRRDRFRAPFGHRLHIVNRLIWVYALNLIAGCRHKLLWILCSFYNKAHRVLRQFEIWKVGLHKTRSLIRSVELDSAYHADHRQRRFVFFLSPQGLVFPCLLVRPVTPRQTPGSYSRPPTRPPSPSSTPT